MKERKLNGNKNISMSEVRKRKKKLEDDLELLEWDFENRLTNVREKVLGKIDPISIIKKNPFKAVGTSVLVGIAIGMMGKEEFSEEGESSRQVHKEKLFNLLFNEVKRVAARKAATYLSDLIDEQISKKRS